jgi:lipopolysaccharide/colanic/teichoic acid biosynthesis glycosyltransferase
MLHEATGLDLDYIEHLSLMTDASILVRTPLAIMGARPGS